MTSGLTSPFVSILRLYRAVGENVYQFGPAAGSSPGRTFARNVTVSGLSGLRNAYTSVRSALGSSAISGASRWLDALAADGPVPLITAATAASTTSNRCCREHERSAHCLSPCLLGDERWMTPRIRGPAAESVRTGRRRTESACRANPVRWLRPRYPW